jgi:hypothetical protein
MSETALFVGGIMDGKKLVVQGFSCTFSVPVMRNRSHVWAVGDNNKCIVEYETYIRVAPHVYLINTEPVENLIPLLIEGYRT